MTKKTAKAWRMVVGQGGLHTLVMAVEAKFFRLFFALYLIKLQVNVIFWQIGGGLLWCPGQK